MSAGQFLTILYVGSRTTPGGVASPAPAPSVFDTFGPALGITVAMIVIAVAALIWTLLHDRHN